MVSLFVQDRKTKLFSFFGGEKKKKKVVFSPLKWKLSWRVSLRKQKPLHPFLSKFGFFVAWFSFWSSKKGLYFFSATEKFLDLLSNKYCPNKLLLKEEVLLPIWCFLILGKKSPLRPKLQNIQRSKKDAGLKVLKNQNLSVVICLFSSPKTDELIFKFLKNLKKSNFLQNLSVFYPVFQFQNLFFSLYARKKKLNILIWVALNNPDFNFYMKYNSGIFSSSELL